MNKIALWKRTSKGWVNYMSWKVTVEGKEYEVAIFTNDKQGNDKRPDLTWTLREPKKKELDIQDVPF